MIADVRLVMSVGAAFRGQVVDENGNPVKVWLTFPCLDHPGASLERLPTDATGRFAAEHLTAGSYRTSFEWWSCWRRRASP